MNFRPIFLLLPMALAAVLAAGCTRSGEPPSAPASSPRHVKVAPVVLSTELPPIQAPGILLRKSEPTLAFKIGGVVAAITVRAGESVQRGQVLARLNPAEIDAQVAQAVSAVDKARRDLARAERLQSERVATLEQVQNARTGLDVAEAQLRLAEFNRRFAVITAPADGRILRRQAEPDELVAAGQPILAFGADAGGWIFRAGVAECDVRRVAVADPATLIFRGSPEVRLEATVAQIAEAADPQTRTFELELSVAGDAGGLRSGAVGTLTLAKPAAVARPRVPLAALLEGQGSTAFLFTLEGDGRKVRRRPVEVATLLTEAALLATPLAPGTRIVVAGAEYLRDGEVVEVAP
ncbi:MAG: efflux RND transporter periplasmic adaptor subunit [Verrucomicrobia bacterium]|nr:efflux RND transporter periplasmic adaptor subunit [Verrucomicrobiota bacterium]